MIAGVERIGDVAVFDVMPREEDGLTSMN